MARIKDREKALKLRLEKEMSYSQIKKTLGISKSTLSGWLRDYPLSEKRIKELKKEGMRRSEQAIERYRNTMRKKKEKRLKEYYQEQKKIIFPLNKRELYLAGLFLYWGEGNKSQMSADLGMSNSDPSIINFFINWLTKILMVPKERIKVCLHLYKDMDIKKESRYWSEMINIPLSQFNKPYIKKTSSERINYKGSFGHGTCQVRIGNARLSEKTLMAIKSIANKYIKKGM